MTSPLSPGDHQVVVAYEMPYRGTALTFDRHMDLDTRELNLIAVHEGATISGEGIGEAQATQMGGETVVTAAAEDLRSGRALRVEVERLPDAAPREDAVLPLPESPLDAPLVGVIGAALAGIGALVAFAYPWVARRTAARRADRLHASYVRVVRQLADLDDRVAAGRIGEERYRAERARLVDRAMALRRQLGFEEGST
jgi:hypothetical protein